MEPKYVLDTKELALPFDITLHTRKISAYLINRVSLDMESPTSSARWLGIR